MVRQLEKMIYDQQPYVFLYSPYRKVIIHQRWGNAIMTSEFPNLIAENLKLISGGASHSQQMFSKKMQGHFPRVIFKFSPLPDSSAFILITNCDLMLAGMYTL
jgi:hypothetical protein